MTALPTVLEGQKPTTRVAAYGLIHDAGHILLCRLSMQIPRWSGYWTLPGGGVNFGEDPEATLQREVEEETGLVVAPGQIVAVHSVHDPISTPPLHGVRLIYTVSVVGGALRAEREGTTDHCAWHPLHGGPALPLVDLVVAALPRARNLWPQV